MYATTTVPLQVLRADSHSDVRQLTSLHVSKILTKVSQLVILIVLGQLTLRVRESYTILSKEAEMNAQFMKLCEDGEARESPRMQRACMEAVVDGSSPMMVRALATAFSQWTANLIDFASRPFQSVGLIGSIMMLSAIPLLRVFHVVLALWGMTSSNAVSGSAWDANSKVVIVNDTNRGVGLSNWGCENEYDDESQRYRQPGMSPAAVLQSLAAIVRRSDESRRGVEHLKLA